MLLELNLGEWVWLNTEFQTSCLATLGQQVSGSPDFQQSLYQRIIRNKKSWEFNIKEGLFQA
jgi:hypothetical protein